jgi:hypothetical protein
MINKRTMPWNSRDLIRLYNDTDSGHYFDADTMRFFRSRVTSNFKRLDDFTALFITTERGPLASSERKATVRVARLEQVGEVADGWPKYKVEIDTLGEFNTLSLYRAKKLMEQTTLNNL